jgi:glycosyltransferase involved in cell wall biosynthesis
MSLKTWQCSIASSVRSRQVPELTTTPQAGLVSIIVPCYNAARFLTETLESAFKQSYSNTELIVIDDGSTDKTAELIRSYGDRLKAEFGPNRGASAARNRGTALARGEFIQYLDSDDVLTPAAVAERVAALQKSGADVAYSDWERLVEVNPGIFKIGAKVVRRIEDIHPDVEIALITSFWAPPAAMTYRRAIVEKIGGWKESLPVIQDARFLQDAALTGGRFIYVPGVGARYREHLDGSLSRRSQAAFVSDVFRNACDLQEIFEGRGGLSCEQRRALAQIYDYAARSLFVLNRAAFRECLTRLYEVEPGLRLSWPKAASLASALFGFKMAEIILATAGGLRRSMRRLFSL